MPVYYFYILRSKSDEKLYYGSTSDLKRRLHEHNSGKVRSTKSRLPLCLVYFEGYYKEELARNREHAVKSSRGSRSSIVRRLKI